MNPGSSDLGGNFGPLPRSNEFGVICGVRSGLGNLLTLICKPQGLLLAGSIVQVRLERKALSAAVGPTCCSGREQRSNTAQADDAISLIP
jgi:hypothetical protein